jgi:hypothetical protein
MIRRIVSWFETHKALSILLVVASLALVLYPRFNRNDIGIIKDFSGLKPGEFSPDTYNYMNFVGYFRHTMPLDSVGIPFNFRPLTPYLSSLLPYDAFTSINIINLISLILSVICIFFIVKKYSFSFGYCIIGCLLFIYSFPFFYYGAVGNVDSPAIFMTCLIVMTILYKKYSLLPLLLLIAPFTKEGTMVIFPFLVLYAWQTGESKQERIKSAVFILLSVITFMIGYMYCRSTFSSGSSYLWKPNFTTIANNMIRPKSYLSLILTIGPVGVFALLQFWNDFKQRTSSTLTLPSPIHTVNVGRRKGEGIYLFFKNYSYTPLLASALFCFLLWIYTFVAAYVDGRYFWFAYPFIIPMAVKFLQENFALKREVRTSF